MRTLAAILVMTALAREARAQPAPSVCERFNAAYKTAAVGAKLLNRCAPIGEKEANGFSLCFSNFPEGASKVQNGLAVVRPGVAF